MTDQQQQEQQLLSRRRLIIGGVADGDNMFNGVCAFLRISPPAQPTPGVQLIPVCSGVLISSTQVGHASGLLLLPLSTVTSKQKWRPGTSPV